jgi:hypothetical protein
LKNSSRFAGSLKVTVSSRPFRDTMPEVRSFHASLTVRKASYRTCTFRRSQAGKSQGGRIGSGATLSAIEGSRRRPLSSPGVLSRAMGMCAARVFTNVGPSPPLPVGHCTERARHTACETTLGGASSWHENTVPQDRRPDWNLPDFR